MSLFRLCAKSLSAAALAGLTTVASAHPGHSQEDLAMGGGPVSAHGHDVLPGIGLCASLALAVALCLGFALSRAGRSGPRKIHSGKIHLAG